MVQSSDAGRNQGLHFSSLSQPTFHDLSLQKVIPNCIAPDIPQLVRDVPDKAMSNTSQPPVEPAGAAASPATEKGFVPEDNIEPHILAKLDPQWLAIFTQQMNNNPPPSRDQFSIKYIRAHPEKFAIPCALDTKGYPRTVENDVTSEDGERVPVRVYYPDEKTWGPGPYPVHLNFHGLFP